MHYNTSLVFLSILIAMLAAYTALDIAGRLAVTRSRAYLGWLLSGMSTFGIGIWAMHFIGMLALRLPLVVHYDFGRVMVSIVPAIAASGLALFLVSRPPLGWGRLVGGSIFIGGGIAAMHYLGMAAMQTPAIVVYDYRLVVASVAIAIGIAFVALWLVARLQTLDSADLPRQKWLSALIMGAAIPCMHYTGMMAAHFLPTHTLVTQPAPLYPPENATLLAAAVGLGTLIISSVALLTTFFDRRLATEMAQSRLYQDNQAYLKRILAGIPVGVLVLDEQGQLQLHNQAAISLLTLATETELQAQWSAAIQTAPKTALATAVPSPIAMIGTQIAANHTLQNEVITLPGTTQSLLANTARLAATPTQPAVTVCTLLDVTDLKQTEWRLQQSEANFKAIAEQTELLHQLSTQIRRSLNLETVLRTAVGEIRQLLQTDRALIYQFDEHWCGQVILEELAPNCSSVLGEVADNCFPPTYLEYYRRGETRMISHVQTANLDPAHYDFLDRLQVQANLIAPIMEGDRLWGLLIVHQCTAPRQWQTLEIQLLQQLGLQLGIAIQHSNLYTQAQQAARQAQAQSQCLQQSEAQLRQQAADLQTALENLKAAQGQLIQSEKMSSLGQLVAGVAHEINNPVNFIYGNLSHLKQYIDDFLSLLDLYQAYYPQPVADIQQAIVELDIEFLQDDLPKIINSMQIGADRIRQIVLSLRQFSRTDEADLKAVDLHEGIDSSLMILQHRLKATADQTAVQIHRDYGPLPLVECYSGPLNQVFMNLLVNAIDALDDRRQALTPVGDPTPPPMITIRTQLLYPDWVQISITDNGMGMSAAVRAKIFDPFYTTKPAGQGTGMGLSISYQIVTERHGGQLTCVSEPGQGTEFILQIPVRPLSPAAPVTAAGSSAFSLSHSRIDFSAPPHSA